MPKVTLVVGADWGSGQPMPKPVDLPAVPRQGEAVRIGDGTQARVVDVEHVLGSDGEGNPTMDTRVLIAAPGRAILHS